MRSLGFKTLGILLFAQSVSLAQTGTAPPSGPKPRFEPGERVSVSVSGSPSAPVDDKRTCSTV